MKQAPDTLIAPNRGKDGSYRMDDVLVPKEDIATLSGLAIGSFKQPIEDGQTVRIHSNRHGPKLLPFGSVGVETGITHGQYTGQTPESHPDIDHRFLPEKEADALLAQIQDLKANISTLLPDLNKLSDFDRSAAELLADLPIKIRGEKPSSAQATIEAITSIMGWLAVRNLQEEKSSDLSAFITWEFLGKFIKELERRTQNNITTDPSERLEFEIDTRNWEDLNTTSDNSIRGLWFERAVKVALSNISSLLVSPEAKAEMGISATHWNAGLDFDNETGILKFRVRGNELRPLTEDEIKAHKEPNIVH